MTSEYLFRGVRSASARRTSGAFDALQQTHYQIFALEPQEILGIHLEASIAAKKLTRKQADEVMKGAHERATSKQKKTLTSYIFNGVTSYAVGNVSTWQSSVVLIKMIRDFGGLGEVVIKEFNGKLYAIFNGDPSLRKIMTNSRYLITDPKVVALGIGRVGIRHVIQSGARVTFVALLGYRFLEHLILDQGTLGQLIGTLASDVVKIGIGLGASFLAMGAVAITPFALGPLLACVVIGMGVSAMLDILDNEFGLTVKLADAIDGMLYELGHKVMNQRDALGRELQNMGWSALEIAAEWLIRECREGAVIFIRRNVDYYLGPR